MAEFTPYSDAEVAAAEARGREAIAAFPTPVAVRYEPDTGRLVIDFENEASFSIVVRKLQGLEGASDAELADVRIEACYALRWESLDVDFTIPGLLAGIFGTARFMAAMGGRSRSPAKAAAARANGKKGGRPKKRG